MYIVVIMIYLSVSTNDRGGAGVFYSKEKLMIPYMQVGYTLQSHSITLALSWNEEKIYLSVE